MRWGKFVLFFQAIITLLIGIIFFIQVFNIQYNYEDSIKEAYVQSGDTSGSAHSEIARYEDFKQRFFNVSYILVIVSLMEIIIVWRLFDHESY